MRAPSGPLTTLKAKMNQPMTLVDQPELGGVSPNGNGRCFVNELAEGQAVAAAFAVRERERRTRRNGEDFLRLKVADRTGTIEAVLWEGVDDCFDVCAPGSVVFVEGPFSVHPQYGAKITIQALRPARDDEYEHADLAEGPGIPAERLEADMRDLVATIQHPDLARLLDRLLGEGTATWERFRVAPAAKYYHQAFAHGLLDHALSVAQAVSAAASAFPGIDRDVAVTGALLHDIGKTQAYNDDLLAIDLTDAGRLAGRDPAGLLPGPLHDRVARGLRPGRRPGGAPHHPVPPRQLRERLARGPRDPRGHARPRHGQPRRQARQLRPDRARAARRRGLVAVRPGDRLGRLLRGSRGLTGWRG